MEYRIFKTYTPAPTCHPHVNVILQTGPLWKCAHTNTPSVFSIHYLWYEYCIYSISCASFSRLYSIQALWNEEFTQNRTCSVFQVIWWTFHSSRMYMNMRIWQRTQCHCHAKCFQKYIGSRLSYFSWKNTLRASQLHQQKQMKLIR